jgi:hypothetical protein
MGDNAEGAEGESWHAPPGISCYTPRRGARGSPSARVAADKSVSIVPYIFGPGKSIGSEEDERRGDENVLCHSSLHPNRLRANSTLFQYRFPCRTSAEVDGFKVTRGAREERRTAGRTRKMIRNVGAGDGLRVRERRL